MVQFQFVRVMLTGPLHAGARANGREPILAAAGLELTSQDITEIETAH
jgi:hypothetical protein